MYTASIFAVGFLAFPLAVLALLWLSNWLCPTVAEHERERGGEIFD